MLAHAFLKPCATVYLARYIRLSLGPELMMEWHNVLLMEMLFLDILTNFAWKPVSQDLYL